MTPKLFSELNLSDEILKAIDRLGFEQASPIQAEAIPALLAGEDIVGQSQTGSGKTAAFAIPAIEKTDPQSREVQALILCPTRELAVQVSEEVHKLACFKRGIRALPIYGGQSYERQFYGLQQGAQIVIGTPGRVMDHMRRGTLRLAQVKLAVLDEADVMLNMGFREDIETILQATPKERQTVFFSATMPGAIRDLIERHARSPRSIKIQQQAMTVPTVEQTYYEVDRRFKIELLARVVDIHDLKRGIIFCNTKRMVDELADHLEAQGYLADRLHGDMSQNQRDRVMNKFRKSGLEFLVATDVAARGIDVDDLQVVFNYDLPYDGEDYVHRIGRTGRAGRSGLAISFASGRELFQIRNIERFTNTRIHRARIPTVTEVEEAREDVFLGKVRALLQSGEFRRRDHLVERLLEEGFASTDITSACLALLQGGDTGPAPAAPRADRDQPPRPEPGPQRDDRSEWRQERRPQPPERREPRPAAPAPAREERPRPQSPAPSLKPAASPSKPVPVPAAPQAAAAPVPPPPARKEPVAKPAPAKQPEGMERKATAPSDPRKAPAPWQRKSEGDPAGHKPVKKAPLPAGDFTRLHMNLGEAMGVGAAEVVRAIGGEAGLPPSVVGRVDVRERHLFVDVATDHSRAIISKLNRARINDHKVKVKLA